ncbi:DNA-binding protein WhiA [[Mycoplasma] mobile]|uniref:Probable cell division protein WhiA n=1 Tax=Mycoplasma mobile (strain ATCC 43663 / 163K / NCTC 11711) TaxID=267748 RepID=Q6KHK0_MYCM1|nr:DNA-binding protein WhiA [[Mycoplasma] mobile]AAT27930.1 expressed protein [Mycoplasma mobile 163K]
MSFSSEVKNEIISNKRNKQEKKLFLQGFLFANIIEESENVFTISLRNKKYIDEINLLLDFFKISFKKVQNSTSKIEILDKNIFKEYPSSEFTHFFSGVFFSGGSISNLSSKFYHLELKINSKRFSEQILNHLKKHNLPFQIFTKNNRDIIYIKKSEMISDFLKAIGAIKNYLKFEDSRIERDYLNYNNKITNLSILNQKKLVETHFKYLEDYQFIIDNNLEKLFTEDELSFFKLKKQNRFESLNELSKIFSETFQINKSKSALNHYLRKLKKNVEKYDKKSKK